VFWSHRKPLALVDDGITGGDVAGFAEDGAGAGGDVAGTLTGAVAGPGGAVCGGLASTCDGGGLRVTVAAGLASAVRGGGDCAGGWKPGAGAALRDGPGAGSGLPWLTAGAGGSSGTGGTGPDRYLASAAVSAAVTMTAAMPVTTGCGRSGHAASRLRHRARRRARDSCVGDPGAGACASRRRTAR